MDQKEQQYFGIEYFNERGHAYLKDILSSLGITRTKLEATSSTHEGVSVVINVDGRFYGGVSVSDAMATIEAYHKMLKQHARQLERLDTSIDKVVDYLLDNRVTQEHKNGWQTLP